MEGQIGSYYRVKVVLRTGCFKTIQLRLNGGDVLHGDPFGGQPGTGHLEHLAGLQELVELIVLAWLRNRYALYRNFS